MTQNNPLLKDHDAIVRIAATPDQTWSFDADHLYKRLDMLRPIGRHYIRQIQLLDLLSDILLVAGVLSAFFIVWWAVFPLVGVACAQRYSNRRRAGELAAKAAQESSDIFLYLYNSGVLSVEQGPVKRRA